MSSLRSLLDKIPYVDEEEQKEIEEELKDLNPEDLEFEEFEELRP